MTGSHRWQQKGIVILKIYSRVKARKTKSISDIRRQMNRIYQGTIDAAGRNSGYRGPNQPINPTEQENAASLNAWNRYNRAQSIRDRYYTNIYKNQFGNGDASRSEMGQKLRTISDKQVSRRVYMGNGNG